MLYLNALKRHTFVLPPTKGFVIVCDEESDTLDTRISSGLTNQLTNQFKCIGLAVINFDDDILWYQLFQNGKLLDEYNSNPDYFEASEHSGAIGGNAQTLCDCFEKPSRVARVDGILHTLHGEGYIFENQRHIDLAKALGFPIQQIHLSYGDLIEVYEGKDDGSVVFAKTLSRAKLKQFSATNNQDPVFDLDRELRPFFASKPALI